MKKLLQGLKGLTLVETLAVLGIISLMMVLITPAVSSAFEQAKVTSIQSDFKNYENALKVYYLKNSFNNAREEVLNSYLDSKYQFTNGISKKKNGYNVPYALVVDYENQRFVIQTSNDKKEKKYFEMHLEPSPADDELLVTLYGFDAMFQDTDDEDVTYVPGEIYQPSTSAGTGSGSNNSGSGWNTNTNNGINTSNNNGTNWDYNNGATGEISTVAGNNIIVTNENSTAYDTNNDGRADEFDLNGNGIIDAWDTNKDGRPDAFDLNENGVIDAWDTNNDGNPDRFIQPRLLIKNNAPGDEEIYKKSQTAVITIEGEEHEIVRKEYVWSANASIPKTGYTEFDSFNIIKEDGDGLLFLHVKATDTYGNVTLASKSFKFDNSAPKVIFQESSFDLVLDDYYDITMNISDSYSDVSSIKYFWTGQSILTNNLTSTYTITPNSSAVYKISTPKRSQNYFGSIRLNLDITDTLGNNKKYTQNFFLDSASGCSDDDAAQFNYELVSDGYKITEFTGTLPSSVDIPCSYSGKDVVEIGDNVFKGNTVVTNFNLPKTLKRIGNSTFEGVTNMKYLSLPESLESIGTAAFKNNTNLVDVEFRGTNIKTISESAFYNDNKITSINLPDSIEAIEANAFYNLTAYKFTSLPKNLVSVGNSSFLSSKFDANLTLPDGLVSIGDKAFQSVGLTSLKMNSKLDSIGSYAFYANKISSIIVPDSVKTIGTYAFQSNNATFLKLSSSLEALNNYSFASNSFDTVSIPNSVKTLSDTAFINNGRVGTSFTIGTGIKEIQGTNFRVLAFQNIYFGDGVEIIGDDTFTSNTNIRRITTGSNLSVVGKNAFKSTTMNFIDMSRSSKITTFDTYSFYGISGLQQLKFPASFSVDTSIMDYAFRSSPILYNLELPEGIIHIGKNAFQSNSIKTVKFPSTLQSIDNYSFANNSINQEISLENIVTIGSYVFQSNSSVRIKTDMPEMQFVGDYAFEGATFVGAFTKEIAPKLISVGAYAFNSRGLTGDMTLPNSLTTVKAYAFANNNFTSVIFPNSVTSYNTTALYNNSSIMNKLVMSDNAPFTFDGNFTSYVKAKDFYTGGMTTLPANSIYGSNTPITHFRFGPGLTTIGSPIVYTSSYTYNNTIIELDFSKAVNLENIPANSFRYLYSLNKINLNGASKLKTIGSSAFYGYTSNLKQVDFGQNISLETIDSQAFYSNANLTGTIDLSDAINLKTIGTYAFASNKVTNLVLPESELTISDYAFNGSTLDEIDFGTVKSIGNYSFQSHKAADINLPDSLTTIGAYAFNAGAAENVTIGSGLRIINNYAFQSNKISMLNIDEGVETINTYAFYNNKLTALNLPSTVQTIGTYAFSTNLLDNSINLPENLKTIQAYAFATNSLSEIVIPNSVTSYDSTAFTSNKVEVLNFAQSDNVVSSIDANYASLRIHNLYTGGSTTVAASAFINNAYIEKIVFGSSMRTIGSNAFQGATKLKEIDLGGVTTVNPYAFRNATLLDTVNYRGVVTISDYAFYNTNLSGHLILPETVLTIGSYAFGSNSYEYVTIPDSVTSFSSAALLNNKIFIEEFKLGAKVTSSIDSNYSATKIKTLYTGNAPTVVANAFENNAYLEKVVFGSGTKTIDNYAFQGATKLKEIDLGGVTTVNPYAFRNATSLETIDYSEVVTLGNYAFQNNKLSGDLVLPETLVTISAYTFGTNSFENITLPDSLKNYTTTAFNANKIPVVNFNVGASVTGVIDANYAALKIKNLYTGGSPSVASNAFQNNVFIETIEFGPNTKTIASYAFSGATNLKQIDLGGVTTVQDYAFSGATNLETIDYSDVVTINSYAFNNTKLSGDLTLPDSLITINSVAFGNNSFENITIPDSVTTLISNAFNANKVPVINFIVGNSVATAIDSNYSALKIENLYTGGAQIAANAFQNNATLKTVTFGSGTKTIGNYAFDGVKNLVDYIYPDNSVVETIGSYAFNNNGMSGEFTFVETVKTINSYAFGNNSFEKVIIPNSVITLNSSAFAGNKVTINEFIIGASVTTAIDSGYNTIDIEYIYTGNSPSIASNAFKGNTYLKSIEFGPGTKLINTYAFQNSQNLENVIYGSESNVQTISDYAFHNTNFSGHLTLPETILTIGSYAFGSNSYEYVTIPDSVTNLSSAALYGNKIAIKEFRIGAKATSSIDSNYPAINIVKLYTGGSTSVGSYVYDGNTTLESIEFGPGMQTVNSYAFRNMTKLKEFTFAPEGNLINFSTYTFYNSKLTGDFNPPNRISVLNSYAFAYNSFDNIIIPDSLTSMNTTAFYGNKVNVVNYYHGAKNTTAIDAQIAALKIENLDTAGSTSIASSAFTNNAYIKTLKVGPKMVYINQYAFDGANILEKIDLSEATAILGIYDYAFRNINDGAGKDTTYTNIQVSPTEIIFPTAFTSNNVWFGNYSFFGINHANKNLIIPKGVNYLYTYAFGYNNLESVKLPSTITTTASYNYEFGYSYAIQTYEYKTGTAVNVSNDFNGSTIMPINITPYTE